jgi:hypothetical protein
MDSLAGAGWGIVVPGDPEGGLGLLATAEALSHFARYVPYVTTAGAYEVLIDRWAVSSGRSL